MKLEWSLPAAVRAGICFVIACGCATPAAAAEDPRDCTTLAQDAERLACYDHLHGRDSAPKRPAETPESAKPASPELAPAAPATQKSLLDERWELEPNSKRGAFRITPYKPVYFLPYFYTNNVNRQPSSPAPGHTAPAPEDIDGTEAKLQFGFKTKLWENVFGGNFSDLWFGYTQSSRWQVYNRALSRPFRETNYEPEALMVFRTDYDVLGWKGRMFSVGLNHQSNGRSLPLSRSWNRVVVPIGLERGNWAVTVRPWMRILESFSRDDNPDIADYMGRGDIVLTYNAGGHEVSAMARHSLRGGSRSHGAVQLEWAFPIKRQLKGYVQWFSGYGESLIDYNHRGSYIGVGVSLLEWYR